jgi:hypothetical protein
LKKKKSQNRTGGVYQMAEHLPSKCEVPCSNPGSAKKKKKKRKMKRNNPFMQKVRNCKLGKGKWL